MIFYFESRVRQFNATGICVNIDEVYYSITCLPSGVEYLPCETIVQHANVGCVNSTNIYCDEKRILIQNYEQLFYSANITNSTNTTMVPLFDFHEPNVNDTTNLSVTRD